MRINGKDCFVYFVSRTQVNVLTPPDTASGPVDVDVMTSHGTATGTVSMARLSPALFTYTVQGVTYAAALIASDYAYVGPVGAVPGVSSRPAKAGDYILLYANGLGPTMPAYPVGQILSGVYPIADLSQVRVLISGKPASVQFAGMTFAGVFQVNIQVPDGLPDGDLRVELQVAGQAPQGNVYIPVAR